jgi:hypothetical protein
MPPGRNASIAAGSRQDDLAGRGDGGRASRSKVIEGKLVRNDRLVARALVKKAKEGDVPAIKEINDRSDGKIVTLADMDDGGLKLEDLIHMSYQVGEQRAKQKQALPAPLLEARDITPKADQ